jgi:oligopeptidase A
MTSPLIGGHDRLPRFDEIKPEQVQPAVTELAAKMIADLERLEHELEPTWEGLVRPLGALTEPLGWTWNVVNHLMSVKNTPELRAAHEAVQPHVVQAFMRLAQSVPIYKGLKALRAGDGWARLDEAQRRIVTASIRDAELSGVGLEGAAQERFQAIELESAELATKFMNNLLDATKAWSLVLTTPEEVEGLPQTLLSAAAQLAEGDAEKGPWKITLDQPIFGPFMEHSRRRDLREKLYRAYVGRASSGELDNMPVLAKILELRREKAKLLGFESYAHVSLAAKMAPGIDAVEKLLAELRVAARPKAKEEHAELTAFARAKSGDSSLELALWDVPFWAERLREERYAYTDEELRPYFALPRVLDGLFATAQRLFDVTIRAGEGVSVWHPDVRFFTVHDGSGRQVAAFYLDPYSRPAEKRGGAWMNAALDRKRAPDGAVRLPVAYLICNMTSPVGDRPALMTFREVETLFHEFGHGLQHMLTTVDHVEAAGISNVEWDAVELPSQFMENWCTTEETMAALARHHVTGEALPRALFEKIRAARTYRAGAATLRQLYFATLDMEMHKPGADPDVLAVQRRVAAENTILPPLPEDRFLCGFSHIFAGGYAAGYYSYKWAEVLSADAFGAFEEAGLGDAKAVAATGRRFRDTVLALGGSRHPLEVFRAFRGRDPSTQPLLKQTGLI